MTDVRIPSLGESVSEGTIARWLKQDGDVVAADEVLLELETDKATMEIPAPSAGRLEILEPAGATVEVGRVVARIAEGDGKGAGAKEAERPAPPPSTTRPRAEPATPLSPAVRKLVAEHDLDPAGIRPTGKGGRLTKADVLQAVEEAEAPPTRTEIEAAAEAPSPRVEAERRSAAPPPIGATPRAAEAALPSRPAAPPPRAGDDVERVPMTGLRRRIAERLVEAQRTAAILTTFNEIDLSEVTALRKRTKERFQDRHGVGLGFMSLFARASMLAIRDLPIVNASIEGDDVVIHRRVHLGIAVGTKRGLVVPVVRNADAMSIAELERAIGELAALARDGKLLPDHLAGGTFTISNGGVYGSLLSTPILNPPQSAILGMHKIEERPVVVGGAIVVRPMMYVALSYDHRLIDGEQAVTFLVRVKERLEDPVRMFLEI